MPRLTFASRPKVRHANCKLHPVCVYFSSNVSLTSIRAGVYVMYDRVRVCLHVAVILAVLFVVSLKQAHDIGERLEVLIETLPGA